ncbi:SDR family oxidoreductase [Streptosporangium algeriense]|uniref:SDR family oxidoreductase n=1 Tax=Streptosporangium algeriense TaxID=1682748 RepID=A0ABW3DWT1_9ACTN
MYEGDLERPESLREALTGVERLYLFPVPQTAAEVVALAAESGTRRIVDLSGAGADDATFEDGYHVVERAVEASGLEWTHIRPGLLAARTLGWADLVRAERTVREPYPASGYPLVHEADVAEVAVAALLTDEHLGAAYTITGPATHRSPRS